MGIRNDIEHLKWCNEHRREQVNNLAKRLSALEAKAGEGKGCDGIPEACKRREYKCEFKADSTMTKAGTLYIDGKKIGDCSQLEIRYEDHETSVHFTTIPDSPPAPQPGDRIKLRDVPVGRWVRFDEEDRVPGHPLEYKVGNRTDGASNIYCGHDRGIVGHSRLARSDTAVTLLPEDYEPGRKAESVRPDGLVADTNENNDVIVTVRRGRKVNLTIDATREAGFRLERVAFEDDHQ